MTGTAANQAKFLSHIPVIHMRVRRKAEAKTGP